MHIRFEFEQEQLGGNLHAFLLGDLQESDVELSLLSENGVAEVVFETTEGAPLDKYSRTGYAIPDDVKAKYNKKLKRYSLRFTKVLVPGTSAAVSDYLADDDVDDTFHDAMSDDGALSDRPSKNSLQEPFDDADADGEPVGGEAEEDESEQTQAAAGGGAEPRDEEARKAAKRAVKKAKKAAKKALKAADGGSSDGGTGGAATAEGEAEEGGAGNNPYAAIKPENGPAALEEANGGSASAASKKKKKKKKKSAAAAADAGTVSDGSDGKEADGADANNPPAPAAAAAAAAESSEDSAAGPRSADVHPTSTPAAAAVAPEGNKTSTPSKAERQASSGLHYVDGLLVLNMEQDFSTKPTSSTSLGTELEAPGAGLQYSAALHGPTVHFSMSKSDSSKKEDRWMEAPHNTWTLPSVQGTTAFTAFGIFDGHGGKESVVHASKNLLPMVAKYLDKAVGVDPALPSLPDQEDSEVAVDIEAEDLAAWAAQEALIERLPKALHAGFLECDTECVKRFKHSGTTATLAVSVGWELLVANVGDSYAYLDTGSQIILISGNHRADNIQEGERVNAAGGEIGPSELGGSARVWPGGLMMTRSLGDRDAAGLVVGHPEVGQISIPPTGARLIVASDGLWDAVQAKNVINQIRGMPAAQAVNVAKLAALRAAGLADDIAIIVADFCPSPEDVVIPALQPGFVRSQILACSVVKPLEALSSNSGHTWRDRLQHSRSQALSRCQEAERQALAAAVEEEAAALPVAPLSPGAAALPPFCRSRVSETYREMAELMVDLTTLESMSAGQEEEEGEAEGWTTVGGGDVRPSYEQELLDAARPMDLYERGEGSRGRGRNRGRSGGRDNHGLGGEGRVESRGGRNRRGGRGAEGHAADEQAGEGHSGGDHGGRGGWRGGRGAECHDGDDQLSEVHDGEVYGGRGGRRSGRGGEGYAGEARGGHGGRRRVRGGEGQEGEDQLGEGRFGSGGRRGGRGGGRGAASGERFDGGEMSAQGESQGQDYQPGGEDRMDHAVDGVDAGGRGRGGRGRRGRGRFDGEQLEVRGSREPREPREYRGPRERRDRSGTHEGDVAEQEAGEGLGSRGMGGRGGRGGRVRPGRGYGRGLDPSMDAGLEHVPGHMADPLGGGAMHGQDVGGRGRSPQGGGRGRSPRGGPTSNGTFEPSREAPGPAEFGMGNGDNSAAAQAAVAAAISMLPAAETPQHLAAPPREGDRAGGRGPGAGVREGRSHGHSGRRGVGYVGGQGYGGYRGADGHMGAGEGRPHEHGGRGGDRYEGERGYGGYGGGRGDDGHMETGAGRGGGRGRGGRGEFGGRYGGYGSGKGDGAD